jgi:hypothetical protein
MPELKHDMELIKRQGFNLAKLQENWAYDEPVEGRIDLSKYEELIEHATRLDLGVYLGLTGERRRPSCGASTRAAGWLGGTACPSLTKPR